MNALTSKSNWTWARLLSFSLVIGKFRIASSVPSLEVMIAMKERETSLNAGQPSGDPINTLSSSPYRVQSLAQPGFTLISSLILSITFRPCNSRKHGTKEKPFSMLANPPEIPLIYHLAHPTAYNQNLGKPILVARFLLSHFGQPFSQVRGINQRGGRCTFHLR